MFFVLFFVFVLQKDNKSQMGARCLFSKSHPCDEGDVHKTCISNPSDVISWKETVKMALIYSFGSVLIFEKPLLM